MAGNGHGGGDSAGGSRGSGGSGGGFTGNGLVTGTKWYGTKAYFGNDKQLKGFSTNGSAFKTPDGKDIKTGKGNGNNGLKNLPKPTITPSSLPPLTPFKYPWQDVPDEIVPGYNPPVSWFESYKNMFNPTASAQHWQNIPGKPGFRINGFISNPPQYTPKRSLINLNKDQSRAPNFNINPMFQYNGVAGR